MKVVLKWWKLWLHGLPVSTEVLSGPINEDITLLSGQIYVIENDVIIGQEVPNGTTVEIIIEPGAIILVNKKPD